MDKRIITKSILERHIKFVGDNMVDVCKKKGGEYTPDDLGALDNIIAIANACQEDPERICMIYATKHYQSLLRNMEFYSLGILREKLTDIHLWTEYAYLFREEALIHENSNSELQKSKRIS